MNKSIPRSRIYLDWGDVGVDDDGNGVGDDGNGIGDDGNGVGDDSMRNIKTYLQCILLPLFLTYFWHIGCILLLVCQWLSTDDWMG